MSGYISENSEFFDVELQGFDEIDISLGGVNYLNSVGVKNWIIWTRRIPDTAKVVFRNCPSLVVNQINMVVDFLPKNAIVDSFYVPYHCDNCSSEKAILVTKGKEFEPGTESKPRRVDVPETIECPKCKTEMEPDVVPEKFFSFLNYRPNG